MTSLTKNKLSAVLKLFSKYKIHFIAWALYITWETFIAGLIAGKFARFPNYVIHYFLNITLFYAHAYVMSKALSFPKSVIWKLPLYIAFEILAYVVIVFYIDSFINTYTNIFQGMQIPPNKIRIFALLWRCLFFVFFSTGYYYLITYLSEKKEKERIDKQRFKVLLEKERTEKQLALAQNALLQAQINPHLLFNTLEFLYQKLKNLSPNDAQAMLYLSEVMRYAASADRTKTFLSLRREIAQCENLISLHGITEGELFTGFAYAPDVEDLPFIPLVLVTVLENMFKHGDLQSDLIRAELSVYQDDKALVIESINAIRAYPHRAGLSSGLSNIKNRLEYAYGAQVSFLYQNEDNTFKLTIRVEKTAIVVRQKNNVEILQKGRID